MKQYCMEKPVNSRGVVSNGYITDMKPHFSQSQVVVTVALAGALGLGHISDPWLGCSNLPPFIPQSLEW